MSQPTLPPATTIAEALDLSTWDEEQGCGSLDGPRCPHCGKAVPITACVPEGVPEPLGKWNADCPHCDKVFAWQIVRSPLGKAWMTWQRPA
jgi:phage terminase large subunit GpA-like protein